MLPSVFPKSSSQRRLTNSSAAGSKAAAEIGGVAACSPTCTPVEGCCPQCRVSSAGSWPAGYERERLQGFYAQTDTLPSVVDVRIVRSCTLAGRSFAVGTAVQSGSWIRSGFIYEYGIADDSSGAATMLLPATLPLESKTLIGTSRLRFPSAIIGIHATCSMQNVLIIVGQGDLVSPDGVGEDVLLPTVAVVTLGSATNSMCVSVQVGAGPTALPDEAYVDVCASPPVSACNQPDTFFVCGHATGIDGQKVATFRKLAFAGLLPVILGNGEAVQQLYAVPHDDAYVDAIGVCVAASCELGFIVVGVQMSDAGSTEPALTQSSVWSLTLDGVPLSSLTLTGFNSAITQQLPLPLSTSGVAIIKILITSTGSVFCVASARSLATSSTLPPSIVAVYAYSSDTAPDPAYGIGGIALWFTDAYGSARPNDAHLLADDAVGVLGNCFAYEAGTSTPDAIYMAVSALPWLSVNVPAPATDAFAPVPFLLRFSACAGIPCLRLLGAPGCPCSTFVWAATFAPRPYGISTGVLIFGDCAQDVFNTSPAAGVLTLELIFGAGNSVRVANCASRRAPLLDAECTGLVTLDTRCAPTTLAVAGGVLIGDTHVEMPGTLRYTPTNGLQLYTHGVWRQIAFLLE